MNRVSPITFGQSPFVPLDRTITTHRGDFNIVSSPCHDLFSFKDPTVIYTDEFLGEIASRIFVHGSNVEINCGSVSFKSEFVASELSSPDLLGKVQAFDRERLNKDKSNLQIDVKKRVVSKGMNLFGLFGKKYLHLELSERPEKVQSIEKDYLEELPWKDSYDVRELYPRSSKYFSAPIIDADVQLDTFEINDMLEKNGIVQIVRGDQKFQHLGLFIEKRENPNEVVFNLNGQNEDYFEGIFEPLVICYLGMGQKVFVDYDLSNPQEISERVFSSGTYRSIFELTDSSISVQQERMNCRDNPHTCAVLEPSSTFI